MLSTMPAAPLVLLLLFLGTVVVNGESEDERAIIPSFPCNEAPSIDRAVIRLDSLTQPNLALFATNRGCYRCTATLLFNSSSTVSTASTGCVNLWTAFAWDLTLRSTSQSGVLLASLEDQRFGEHGQYNITYNPTAGALEVVTVSPPDDPNTPFYVLTGVLALVALTAFFIYPAAEKWIKSGCIASSRRGSRTEKDLPPCAAVEPGVGIDAELSAPLLAATTSAAAPAVEVAAAGAAAPAPAPAAAAAAKKHPRLDCLDAFRGLCLCLMIFVNYGGGHYWFTEHSAWNGLTIADVLFPWFMWVMGVSMALSMGGVYAEGSALPIWQRVITRSCTLIGLGLFLSNGYSVTAPTHHWRLLGVLQYFGVSYFFVAATMLVVRDKTRALLRAGAGAAGAGAGYGAGYGAGTAAGAPSSAAAASVNSISSASPLPPLLHKGSARQSSLWQKSHRWVSHQFATPGLASYRLELPLQIALLLVYLCVCLFAAAPGCPRGYNGPGGIGDDGAYPNCTGGIHRYIDERLFGYEHYYHSPTCRQLYACTAYDPEGILGSLSATTLTLPRSNDG